jgi:RNA polymerase sigma factor, sigma-70 family
MDMKETTINKVFMFDKEDDISIWTSFLSGNDQVYEYMYRQHFRNLYMYGLTLSSDEELVKDCIHDIFVHIYENRKNLGKTNNIRLYLISSLKNAILMAFRKQNTYNKFKEMYDKDLTDNETAIATIIEQETEAERKSLIETVWSALTVRQKEIIYYRYVEGLSLSEIAERESMDYHSVANIIQRGIKKLKLFYNKSD